MEIEIIPVKLGYDIFEDYQNELIRLQDSQYCFLVNTEFIKRLLIIDMPIANRRLAIKNILNFLTWLHNDYNSKDTFIYPIPIKKLIEFFKRDTYKKYMQILKDEHVLSDIPYEDGTFYLEGKYYKQYRFFNSYIDDTDLSIVILADDRAKDNFTCTINIDQRYVKTIKEMQINMRNALEAEINYCRENNLDTHNLRIRISRLFYTKMKRFIKKGKTVDRIYHSFSNVSKVSRKHINIKMHNIDIKNCQPLMLVSYLTKNSLPFDITYRENCEDGLFYESFVTDKMSREEVKVALYKNIFFGFYIESNINKKFKELYPLTWQSLNNIRLSNISLAMRLQNMESTLFNNLIPVKSKYFFTLFDAIYFDNIEDASLLYKNINTFFSNLGIKFKTDIDQ